MVQIHYAQALRCQCGLLHCVDSDKRIHKAADGCSRSSSANATEVRKNGSTVEPAQEMQNTPVIHEREMNFSRPIKQQWLDKKDKEGLVEMENLVRLLYLPIFAEM